LKLALTHNPLPNPSWFSVILTLQKIPINLITIIINLKEQSTTQNTMFCLKQLDITNYKWVLPFLFHYWLLLTSTLLPSNTICNYQSCLMDPSDVPKSQTLLYLL
jgi:hypothetical protein